MQGTGVYAPNLTGVSSTDPGREHKAALGISVQSTAKGWSSTIPSQSSPRVSAYPTSFLWQSQVDGPIVRGALISNVSAKNNKTLDWKVSSSPSGRPQTHQLLLWTPKPAALLVLLTSPRRMTS